MRRRGNTATISGGGAATATATNPTIINPAGAAAWTITATHSGNFTQGQNGAAYTITVSNTGTGPTTGGLLAQVFDTLPTGLTAVSFQGTGWSCQISLTIGCNRSDSLPAGASYPAITLTVNVAANAPATVTNAASISGAGVTGATANDPTTINPFGTVSCSFGLTPGAATLPATGTSTVETCPNNSGQPNCGVTPETPRTFTVTPSAACGAWTATSSNPGLLRITSGTSGNGTGSAGFTLLNNTHNGSQSYTITLASGTASTAYSVTEAGSGNSQVYREVYALYAQLLGRDPDPAGFGFWSGSGGAGLGQMADSFLTNRIKKQVLEDVNTLLLARCDGELAGDR